MKVKRTLLVAVLSSIAATGVFAVDAAPPVYDADNYPPQFDGSPDAGAQAPAQAQQVPASAQEAQAPVQQPPTLQPEVISPSQSDNTQQTANDTPTTPDSYHNTPPSTNSLSLDQRLRQVEQQIINMQQSGTSGKMDSLQNQVQTLRGQVEELTHQLQQLQNQQRAIATDVDKRLSQSSGNQSSSSNTNSVSTDATTQQSLDQSSKTNAPQSEKTTVNSGSASPVKLANNTLPSSGTFTKSPAAISSAKSSITGNQPNVAEEQQIYQTAYDLIKAKKYNQAIAALQKMLQKYPTGQFAANAHYWLGELYGLLNKNDLSAQEFSTVVNDFPDSPKVADAQLKVGLILAGQFKWVDAKSAFKKIINHYPGTSSARLAAEQLKQIKLAGH